MGGGSKVPANTTSEVTQTNQASPEARPYISPLLSQSWALAQRPYLENPHAAVADLTSAHQAATNMGWNLATANPLLGAASTQLTGTLQGSGFDNPYLTDAIRMAQEEQIPGIGFMSRQGGSYGNTGIAQAAAENMGDISSSMRFANYNAERDRQMQAAQMAPSINQQQWQNVQSLAGIGDMHRQYQQQLLDARRAEWENMRQWPYEQRDWFANQLRGAGYGTGIQSQTSTEPNPYAGSGLASMIGGGLAGAALLKELLA